MKPLRSRGAAACAFLLTAGLALTGCSEEKGGAVSDAGAPDGPSGPVVGGKLGAALAAAATAQPAPSGKTPGQADGPPESGVFPPGAGDKAHAPGAPATVELLGEGSDPKVPLTFAAGSLAEQKQTLTVAVRLGPQQALPTLEFALVARLDKPKDDKAVKAADKKPDVDPAAPARIVVKVAAATLARDQPGALPKELQDQIAKLKGTEIRYALSSQGITSDLTYALPKDADPGLDPAVRALVEALGFTQTPVPPRPVGAGAYWMVTDRYTSMSGLELVRYRVFKVGKIDKAGAALSVEIRQYAAKDQIAGPRGSATVDRFESQGKAAIDWIPQIFASGADVGERLGARLAGQGNQRGTVQQDLNARLGNGSQQTPPPAPPGGAPGGGP